jgi:hypothetical protein
MAGDLPRSLLAGLMVALLSGCTLHHSRQAVWTPHHDAPSAEATFVTEEDSGLMLLGVFQLSEPDHYAVLMERARRRYACDEIHHAQLDFFTDHWLLVAFPIARMTMVCETRRSPAAPPRPSAAPARPSTPAAPIVSAPSAPPPPSAPPADDADAGPPPEAP